LALLSVDTWQEVDVSISESIADRSARRRIKAILQEHMPAQIELVAAALALDVPDLPNAYYVLTAGDLVKDVVEQGRIICSVEPATLYSYGSPPIAGTPNAYERFRNIEVVTAVRHFHAGREPLAYLSDEGIAFEESVYDVSEVYTGAMIEVLRLYVPCSNGIVKAEKVSAEASVEVGLHRHGILATASVGWNVEQILKINHGVAS
jgi:hypothetical protein